jgi:hypothetical protein
MTEVNRALKDTQSGSFMATEGALLESILPQNKGADYDAAFQPAN